MKSILFLPIIVISLVACENNTDEKTTVIDNSANKNFQDSLVEKYVYNCADQYNYNLPEYQICLDSALAIDSTIAYVWQQKSMPLFKQMKYQVGMKYIDKAVKYDSARWLPYRAFIKCIFQKDYPSAIADFEECISKYGNSYEMDHTYNFYIALSYLQLNEFEKAEKIFAKEIDSAVNLFGKGAVHYLDLFYHGISLYELREWEKAIDLFDQALDHYPNFSDAQYYKAICLLRIDEKDAGQKLIAIADSNKNAGNTINEDNEVYERYPYQLY